jgi:hypothetical protein
MSKYEREELKIWSLAKNDANQSFRVFFKMYNHLLELPKAQIAVKFRINFVLGFK